MHIAIFPQLIAEPIVRYSQIEDQINNRTISTTIFAQVLRLFIIGLRKKTLPSKAIVILADSMLTQDAASIGFVGCAFGVLTHAFRIYFDFSGYSDMAIGLGKMMEFDYPCNCQIL